MKILLSILMAVAPVLGYAQTVDKIIEANGALGIASQPNYVINSNAEKNTNNVTATNIDSFNRVDIGTSANAVIDGKWSFIISDDGNNGIIRFAANPMNSGKSGQNCAAFMRYSLDSLGDTSNNWSIVVEDASNNEISPRVRLSDTYNSLLAPNPGISRTALIPGYPCKAGQQNVFAVKHLAAVASQLIIDEIHVIDYPFPTSVPQGAEFFGSLNYARTLSCLWSRTGSTSWGDFSADTDCATPTVKGNVTAPGTKIPALVLPAGAPPGRYVFTAIGGIYKQGTMDFAAAFRFNDGTNSSSPGQVYNSASSTQSPTIVGEITYTSALSSATTVRLQGVPSVSGGIAAIDVSSPNLDFEIQVIRYPLTGSNDVVVPASCINNPECQNVFSAQVTSAGVVSSENVDWLNGNCTASNPWTCTFRTSLFSASPTCLAMSVNTSSTTNVTSVSASSVVLTNTAGNQAFNLVCIRAGSEWKSGPFPWLTGMVSSNSTSNLRYEDAFVSGGNPPTILNPTTTGWLVFSTRTAAGDYTFTHGFGVQPKCGITPIAATRRFHRLQTLNTTTIRVVIEDSAGTPTDTDFTIWCTTSR